MKEKGFTLIELLVVITIIGITLAFSIPNIRSSLRSQTINSALNQTVSQLLLARQRAISEDNDYVITYTIGGSTFTVHDNDDSDRNSVVQDSGEKVTTVTLPRGITFVNSSQNLPNNPITFAFKPNGSVIDPQTANATPSSGFIRLQSSNGLIEDVFVSSSGMILKK